MRGDAKKGGNGKICISANAPANEINASVQAGDTGKGGGATAITKGDWTRLDTPRHAHQGEIKSKNETGAQR